MSLVMNPNSEASKLLNFSERLDINLLDKVVGYMYTGQKNEQMEAQTVLTTLKEHPDAWTRVDAILEYSQNPQTKYFALQILENVIKTRWKALPRDQCEGIKTYIVGLIIRTSSLPEMHEKHKLFLTKLNFVLVQILKKEWPKNWPSFITDIVGASKTNEWLCLNNMEILRLMSEEIFDYSSGTMTQAKTKHLKESMCAEFQQVFQLCLFVLENSTNPALVGETLRTLLLFLNWIPLGYVFETNLVPSLISKFLTVPMFRNVTLKCLTEVSGISTAQYPQYEKAFKDLFSQTMEQLKQILPLDTDIRGAYAKGTDDEQKFIQNLAMFLASYLKEHVQLVEKTAELRPYLLEGLKYLLLISVVEETEIFKICLELWNTLSSELYLEHPFNTYPSSNAYFPALLKQGYESQSNSRRKFYDAVLTDVRLIMIARMAKPEEVLVVENEQGEVVREFMKDTDSINMYKLMRETLVYLTHLDTADTERIMTDKLQRQVDGSEWGWKNLNTLCWAIGSISGAMHEEDEMRFLVTVIKDLLGLCEMKRGKDNKAIIASNIMYIVGQYPRFLRAHWKFLKTVVNKLFEFMHETHDGVQDMACDTFIKIAQKCRRHFVTVQIGETFPFIDEILQNLRSIICDLSQQQVQTFYEAIGYMISSEADDSTQANLIDRLMSLPNQIWDETIQAIKVNPEALKDVECLKQFVNVLRANHRACISLGNVYVHQLKRNFYDMLQLYNLLSQSISQALMVGGDMANKGPYIKAMRTVKKEILKILSTWISKATNPQMVYEYFIPHVFESILNDYKSNVPDAREPEVLSLLRSIVERLENVITPRIGEIFSGVFECTLEMINKNFEEYPEHRTNFFLLIQSINQKCFPGMLAIPGPQFKLIIDSVVWAFKHHMRNVAEIGLHILYQMLKNIGSQSAEVAQSFYKAYYLVLLEHLFSVASDPTHSGNLNMFSTIIAYMFSLVDDKKVAVALGNTGEDNVAFLQNYLQRMLKAGFPHLTDSQIKITVQGMFQLDQDVTQFKEHLRDFLVQIKEYTGDDETDLFLEERETQLKKAQDDKRKIQMAVPGILNPHEIDDMED
ncbi:hypothetical protein RvY_11018 [Ramazzottius varieornatus]|uniref:Importin N-terminal domain-containing protein n=1 Tax=Ramazzottius varieornatus TaxID=947166 RepID=A0A1D1VEQ3_RAMVA|nr:hypothetical protein RvY_11018 [Ramazzottius varieornatus]